MFLFKTTRLSDVHMFISTSVSLSFIPSKVQYKWKSFSTLENGQNRQCKQDLVSQGSVSGITSCYYASKWAWSIHRVTHSFTRSSLGHNEKIVSGVDMVWKLCAKESSPKFKWLVRLLFVLCGKRLKCWKPTKIAEWISRGLCIRVGLDELKWLNFGRAPSSTLKTVSDGWSGLQWSKCATDVQRAWSNVPHFGCDLMINGRVELCRETNWSILTEYILYLAG